MDVVRSACSLGSRFPSILATPFTVTVMSFISLNGLGPLSRIGTLESFVNTEQYCLLRMFALSLVAAAIVPLYKGATPHDFFFATFDLEPK